MFKRIIIVQLLGIGLLFLSGCNLPYGGNPNQVGDSPDVVFTAAAETTEAQFSPTNTLFIADPTSTLKAVEIKHTPTPEIIATSTPTETPIPTDIPEVIFFDDFSDSSGWYVNENDRFGFKYTSDGYHIYNNIKMGLIWSIRDQTYSGVAIEVDGTRLEGPEDSYFGVVCKFAEDGDNYYTLVIADNGFFGFGIMEDGEYEFIETGIDEAGIINRGKGEVNRIRGVCNGNHFLLYANGKLLLDVWDDTYEEGIIGLVVGNQRSDGGTEFRFNDFAITWP